MHAENPPSTRAASTTIEVLKLALHTCSEFAITYSSELAPENSTSRLAYRDDSRDVEVTSVDTQTGATTSYPLKNFSRAAGR